MIRRVIQRLAIAATMALPLSVSAKEAPEPPKDCKPASINISTGVDDAGNALPVGTADLHWQNSQGMGNVTTPNSGWDPLSGSYWLGNGSTATSNTNFVYTLSFSNPTSGNINFTSLADNNVTIELDGIQVAQTPGAPSIYGFHTANAASYSASVAAGSHTLTATVHNLDGASGFNLSGTVTYSLVPVTMDLSTGVNGSILPLGAQDPNWSGTYNYVDYMSSWDVLSGSAWIGDASYSPPAGGYTYTRNFTIPTPGTISLEGLADNTLDAYIDGTPVMNTPGYSIYGFQLANLASYTGSVSAGTHTITVKVYNEGGPVGLNIHGSVTYCGTETKKCLSDASFYGVYLGALGIQLYSNNIQQSNTIVTHNWDFGDGTTSTSVSPVHTYSSPGGYLITHTVFTQVLNEDGKVINECKDYRECKMEITKEDKDGQIKFSCNKGEFGKKSLVQPLKKLGIAPNPVQSDLNLQGIGDRYELQITSMDGKTVLANTTYPGTQTRIDVSNLAQGVYIAVIKQGGMVTRIRFAKAQ